MVLTCFCIGMAKCNVYIAVNSQYFILQLDTRYPISMNPSHYLFNLKTKIDL